MAYPAPEIAKVIESQPVATPAKALPEIDIDPETPDFERRYVKMAKYGHHFYERSVLRLIIVLFFLIFI